MASPILSSPCQSKPKNFQFPNYLSMRSVIWPFTFLTSESDYYPQLQPQHFPRARPCCSLKNSNSESSLCPLICIYGREPQGQLSSREQGRDNNSIGPGMKCGQKQDSGCGRDTGLIRQRIRRRLEELCLILGSLGSL